MIHSESQTIENFVILFMRSRVRWRQSPTHTHCWLLLTYSWRSAKRGAGARLEVRGRTSYRRTRRSHHHNTRLAAIHPLSPSDLKPAESLALDSPAVIDHCSLHLHHQGVSFFLCLSVGCLDGRSTSRAAAWPLCVSVCLYTQLDNTTRSKPSSGTQHCLGVNKCNKFSSFSAI